MSYTIPASGSERAHYGYNKLVVYDLEKAARFYERSLA